MTWTVHYAAPGGASDKYLCENREQAIETALDLRGRGYLIERIDDNNDVWMKGADLGTFLDKAAKQ